MYVFAFINTSAVAEMKIGDAVARDEEERVSLSLKA